MELGTTLRSPERVERLVLVDTYGIQRTAPMHRFSEIQTPTLIVHGRQDKGVPLACAVEAHQRIPGSRLHIIEEAGHWPQREKPDEFIRVVSEFLED